MKETYAMRWREEQQQRRRRPGRRGGGRSWRNFFASLLLLVRSLTRHDKQRSCTQSKLPLATSTTTTTLSPPLDSGKTLGRSTSHFLLLTDKRASELNGSKAFEIQEDEQQCLSNVLLCSRPVPVHSFDVKMKAPSFSTVTIGRPRDFVTPSLPSRSPLSSSLSPLPPLARTRCHAHLLPSSLSLSSSPSEHTHREESLDRATDRVKEETNKAKKVVPEEALSDEKRRWL